MRVCISLVYFLSLACHILIVATSRRYLYHPWLNDTPFDSHILSLFPISVRAIGLHPRAVSGFPLSPLTSEQLIV